QAVGIGNLTGSNGHAVSVPPLPTSVRALRGPSGCCADGQPCAAACARLEKNKLLLVFGVPLFATTGIPMSTSERLPISHQRPVKRALDNVHWLLGSQVPGG